MKPKIYIAGKIAKNDFRHRLVPQLRGMEWPGKPIECGRFIYCGPFFAGCDHGCSHGPSRHGVVSESACHDEQYAMTDKEIRDLVIVTNNDALASADFVFAYIDCLTAYGTLVELGAAYAMGKQVILFFGKRIYGTKERHLWYAAHQADVVYQNTTKADFCRAVETFCDRAILFARVNEHNRDTERDGDNALFDDDAPACKHALH